MIVTEHHNVHASKAHSTSKPTSHFILTKAELETCQSFKMLSFHVDQSSYIIRQKRIAPHLTTVNTAAGQSPAIILLLVRTAPLEPFFDGHIGKAPSWEAARIPIGRALDVSWQGMRVGNRAGGPLVELLLLLLLCFGYSSRVQNGTVPCA